jgi:hypothetical protein
MRNEVTGEQLLKTNTVMGIEKYKSKMEGKERMKDTFPRRAFH